MDAESIISMEVINRHLNISTVMFDSEYLEQSERPILLEYRDSAIGYVEQIICRKVEDLTEREMAVFRQAVLLVIGDFYMQREDTVVGVSVATSGAVRRLTNSIRGWG